jgi:hypothetical protein
VNLPIERIDDSIERLEDIKQAILSMKPDRQQGMVLNRVYNALTSAQRELAILAGNGDA